jgi:hypothetical protein
VIGDQFGGDGRGQLKPAGCLGIGGRHVEGVEELDQLFLVGHFECLPHILDRVEHRDDLVGAGAFGLLGAEGCDRLFDGLLAGRQFLDTTGDEGDDGAVGVVVLLRAHRVWRQGPRCKSRCSWPRRSSPASWDPVAADG